MLTSNFHSSVEITANTDVKKISFISIVFKFCIVDNTTLCKMLPCVMITKVVKSLLWYLLVLNTNTPLKLLHVIARLQIISYKYI